MITKKIEMMVEWKIGVRVKNKLVGTRKINSLKEWGQIIRSKIELKFNVIDCNSPINRTAILKTKEKIKNDNVLVKTDIKKMFLKLKKP